MQGVAKEAESLLCSWCWAPSSHKLQWKPVSAHLHAHPRSQLRHARQPSPLPEPQSAPCRRSGSRQALDDGGEQVTGAGFSSSASVPAGSERSAALGSGRARGAAGCRGAAGVQPLPQGEQGRGLQPCAKPSSSRAGQAGRVERDRGSEAAQGEWLGCKMSCLSCSGASNGLGGAGDWLLLPWGSIGAGWTPAVWGSCAEVCPSS